ncbi:MAG: hypothetical protein K2J28_00110, partial [Duncaniella sp.]|nr:hypothetical protein [Duncaniella sp.]
MKKLLSFLVVIILTGLLTACSDDDGAMESVKDTPYYSTAGEVKIFKDEMVNYSTLGENDFDLVLDGNTPSEALPKKGEIICIKPCDKFVSGFVGKVEEIKKDDSKFVVQTSIPALTEIFENLSLDIEATSNPEDMLILDTEGNKIDVILDTETSAEDLINGASATSQTRGGVNWENTLSEVYKISYTTKKTGDNSGFNVVGKMAVASTTKFAVDINDRHLDYLKYNVNPSFYVGIDFSAETERGWDYSDKDAIELFYVYPFGVKGLIVTTPAGIPVVLHPKFAIVLEAGIKGQATLTSTLQWRCGAELGIEKKSRNSDCVPYCKKHDYNQSIPFAASEIEIEGEVFEGLGAEFSVGFYTKGASVGATLSGKLAEKASFTMDAINLEISNPKVTLGLYVNASVFAKLSVFDEKIKLEARYNVIDNWKVFEDQMWLFPEYSQFEANASGNSGEVSYYVDPTYIMKFVPGFQSGMAILDSNESLVVTKMDDNTSNNFNSLLMHMHFVDGLASGTTYYACPWVKCGAFEWFGEKHEFTTEASYHLGFRCASYSYDVISFNFSLNNITGNVIDYTTE